MKYHYTSRDIKSNVYHITEQYTNASYYSWIPGVGALKAIVTSIESNRNLKHQFGRCGLEAA